ncbi:MAG TPA: SprT family zinc-dependent metalloprotease [Candidatus Limnocylindrales bacterium]|nr:SprT family zinc-dependent metalloprotease [Candidatus Limnocylindrales bacterium]
MSKKYFYLGKKYELGIRLGQKNIIEVDDKIYLGISSNNSQSYLLSWYREQARKIILERVYHYSLRHGLHFNSVTVGSVAATTRWGSCSSQKNLNFNWKLIMAPIQVIDYVVVHELSHLSELNHSRAFWENVRKMLPLYREYRLWLKRNGHMLTL